MGRHRTLLQDEIRINKSCISIAKELYDNIDLPVAVKVKCRNGVMTISPMLKKIKAVNLSVGEITHSQVAIPTNSYGELIGTYKGYVKDNKIIINVRRSEKVDG